MSSKRMSISKRVDPNDAQTRNIRFDYSDIHLENEHLNVELEHLESNIHRQRFQKTVDSEETYKKAKKDADVMLQLKNAVNSRRPHTSFERVAKSAGARPKPKAIVQKEKTSPDFSKTKSETDDVTGDHVDAIRPSSGTSTDTTTSEQEEKPASKPFNNLTMFLLSLHRFKSAANRNRGENSSDVKDTQEERENPVPTRHSQRPSRPSSYVPRARSAIQADVAEKYGIHVKKDHSRSRRTLGEISKLEHDSKYGHVDLFEERRKRLLAACKNTQTLDLRIQKFLKEIDHFKKLSCPDNSLERVLMRSKSAYGVRGHPPEPW